VEQDARPQRREILVLKLKQGAERHAHAVRGNDLYETPPEAVHALLRHERLPKVIWEPAAGRGAISRELETAGHNVFSSDLCAYDGREPNIRTGIDFLETRYLGNRRFSTIVTNPPYKIADKFVRHGLKLGCKVIVLQRLMAIEGAGRSDLMDKHCVRIWAGIERLPMMHRDGWQGKKLAVAGVPFAWFVFHPSQRDYSDAIELRRISWRA
jgi:hypothetical protein